jgi:hypothetical protein
MGVPLLFIYSSTYFLAHATRGYLKEYLQPTGQDRRRSFQRLIRSQKVTIKAATREQFGAVIEEIKRFEAYWNREKSNA